MSFDKVFVGIASLVGVIFTYWFFLMKKETAAVVVGSSVDIIVKGGYSPDVIEVLKGKKTTIQFLRKDSSSCLEEVVLPEFKIKKYLPLNKTVSVEITPKESGTFEFVCGMNMFHGKIIVN